MAHDAQDPRLLFDADRRERTADLEDPVGRDGGAKDLRVGALGQVLEELARPLPLARHAAAREPLQRLHPHVPDGLRHVAGDLAEKLRGRSLERRSRRLRSIRTCRVLHRPRVREGAPRARRDLAVRRGERILVERGQRRVQPQRVATQQRLARLMKQGNVAGQAGRLEPIDPRDLARDPARPIADALALERQRRRRLEETLARGDEEPAPAPEHRGLGTRSGEQMIDRRELEIDEASVLDVGVILRRDVHPRSALAERHERRQESARVHARGGARDRRVRPARSRRLDSGLRERDHAVDAPKPRRVSDA